MRGLDQYLTARGSASISALGTALVDCAGGDSDRPFRRGDAFQKLGYRVAVLRDDDKKPTAGVEKCFSDAGGAVFAWRQDRALEDELFFSLTEAAVIKMLNFAIELHGEPLVDDQIRSASKGTKTLNTVQMEPMVDDLSVETRIVLAAAARTKKAGWFKSVSWMEQVASEIVAPDLAGEGVDEGFAAIIAALFAWADNG